VKERISGRDDLDPDTLFCTSTVLSSECETAVKNAIAEVGGFTNVYESVAGCTVSCHCGPGTMGVLFARK